MRWHILAFAITIGMLACAPQRGARQWECIAPAKAGGGWDLACRTAAQALHELELSPGPVRTINMPGAGGGIGYAHVVSRRHGDPSVLGAASTATTLRLAQRQFGPLTEADVRWVGAIAAEYGVLAVAADAPWPSLTELIETLRRDPSSLIVSGGSAVAGQDHMKMLLIARSAGIDPRSIRYVPFDGGGEAMTALLGGFVQLLSGEASEMIGQVEAGRVRVLTVLAPQRLPGALSDVPTAREHGVAVDWVTWRGFYAPAGLPEADYERWVQTLTQLASATVWSDIRERNRLQPFFLAGPEFERFVTDQVDSFRVLSREIGLIR